MDNNEKETISLNTIIVKYLRHWKLFLIAFILSFIPAYLYLNFFPRTYGFVASILLQEDKESGLSSIGLGGASNLMKSFGIGSSSVSSLNVDDEIEILASNRIQRLMVLNLGINVVYSDPYSLYEMYQEAPLKLTVDSVTMASLSDEYRFNVSVSPGKVQVKGSTVFGKWKENYTFSSLPATIKVGADTFTFDFDNDGEARRSFKLKIKCIPAGWMAENVTKKIVIEDVSSASNVLLLSYSDHSKQRGLDMLNTLIQTYNSDAESFQNKEDMKSMQYVDNRIAHIITEIDKVESGLEAFKKKNDMTLLEADVTLYSESYKDIQAALMELQIGVYQIDMLNDFLKDPENLNKAIPSVFTAEEGEKGAVTQYNRAVINRERVLLNSNENNSMVQLATKEVSVLRESVDAMIYNSRESITKTMTDLKNKEKQLMAKFSSVPEKEREYIGFVRDQEILNGIYLMMLQKREETYNSLAKQTDRARLIEPPYIKRKPLNPRRLYACIGILAFTLIVPVGLLLTKDLLKALKEEYKKTKG